MQCQEEVQVAQDFPIVLTTRATLNEQGFTFEGQLIDDGGHEILTYGFIYIGVSKGTAADVLGHGFGTIIYALGSPGNEAYTLTTTSVNAAPTFEYRAFVTYMENSTKKTVYGNVQRITSKTLNSKQVWSLIAANESFAGSGEVLAVANYYRSGSNPEAHFIQQDGKVTKFDINTRTILPSLHFPLNASQEDLKLYSATPFVINSQSKNFYRLQENRTFAVITQLPFDPELLAGGDVYVAEYYPYVYIFGSFGTHLYNYRDNVWETGPTFPLSPGQAIVAGTNIYDQHYILTTDGSIRKVNGTTPSSLYTTFPGTIEGPAYLFFANGKLYVGLNNPSGAKIWQFDPALAEWSEDMSFPEPLNHPIYFRVGAQYMAIKKANGNYDIWELSQYY